MPVIYVSFVLCSIALAESRNRAEEEVITVQGKASLTLGEMAWEAALQDALQKAISQAADKDKVKGEDEIQEHVAQELPALKQGRRYVERWRIISETKDKEHLNLNVEVALVKNLGDTLRFNLLKEVESADLEALYDWIGRPKTLVDIEEYIEGIEGETNISQIEIERMLKGKGIDIYEKKQLERIKARARELSYDDPDKAQVLNADYGIQLVIEGKCISNFRGEITTHKELPPVKDYTTYLSLKFYRTTTAWKFTPQQYDDSGVRDKILGDSGALAAATKSIKYVLEKNLKDILGGVVNDWRRHVINPRPVEVIVSKFSSNDLDSLIAYLLNSQVEGIRGIPRSRINLARNIARFDIQFRGPQSVLEEALKKYNSSKKLELVEKEEDHLTFKAYPSEAKETAPSASYEILVGGITLPQLKDFQNFLEDEGVSVEQGRLEGGKATLEIRYSKPLSLIVEDILPIFSKPKLIVVGFSRVRAELYSEDAWHFKQRN